MVFWLAPVLLLLTNPTSHAQEAPLFTTPIMDPDAVSHRQSVCDLQAQFYNGTLTLRDALQGVELRPVLFAGDLSDLFLQKPFTALPEQNPGIIVEVLDEMAQRGGFTWRNSYGVADLDTIPSGVTFNEVLQWTTDFYDISCSLWTKSIERVNLGASFPEGWYDASIILVGPAAESGYNLNIWSFLEPFSTEVWVLILVTIVVSGLIYWWMERYDQDTDQQELGGQHGLENLFIAALSFTGDNRYEPSTNFARIYVFSMAFFFLIIGSAYTANLASFLVVQNTPTLQVEGVSDAVAKGLVMCTVGGGSTIENVVRKAHPGVRLVLTDTTQQMYQGVRDGKCDLVLTSLGDWNRERVKEESNPGCNLQWIGRVFRFFNGGFAVESDSGTLCTSLIRDVFNLHMLEMIEEGVLEELWKREYERTTTVTCNADVTSSASGSSDGGNDDDSSQLSIQDMGGIFIVHYTLVFLAVVTALLSKRKNPLHGIIWGGQRQNSVSKLNNGDMGAPTYSDEPGSSNDDNSVPLDTLYAKQYEHLAALTQQMKDMMQQLDQVQKQSKQMGEKIRQNRNQDITIEA